MPAARCFQEHAWSKTPGTRLPQDQDTEWDVRCKIPQPDACLKTCGGFVTLISMLPDYNAWLIGYSRSDKGIALWIRIYFAVHGVTPLRSITFVPLLWTMNRMPSPGYVQLWTPQLRVYSEDAEIFSAEPFATAFHAHLNTRTTRDGGVSLLDRLSKTLETPHYVTLLYDWLSFTLGRIIVECLPEDALNETHALFLNVLFICYQYGGQKAGEEMAYQLLAEAQMANFRRHFISYDEDNTPAEFSLVDELDIGKTWRPNKNAESDWEDISDREEGIEMGNNNVEMGKG
ncbi:hypothetical protein K438DRAFT_2026325 [Mycena galopus ATCC 62051]|nr:hypothetical protein K438DRAFT_2026325 [Mycena galopus ATCC 62051]